MPGANLLNYLRPLAPQKKPDFRILLHPCPLTRKRPAPVHSMEGQATIALQPQSFSCWSGHSIHCFSDCKQRLAMELRPLHRKVLYCVFAECELWYMYVLVRLVVRSVIYRQRARMLGKWSKSTWRGRSAQLTRMVSCSSKIENNHSYQKIWR